MRVLHVPLLAAAIALCAAIAMPMRAFADAPMAAPDTAARPGIADFVAEAARRFAIDERWIYGVIGIESAGNWRAVSPKGASGIMQIMPATWTRLRARYGLGSDIFDPRDNILAGTAYLRELLDRYGSPGFLAAYNAGPARYEDYLRHGRPLPAETVAYVRRLTSPGSMAAPQSFAPAAPPRLDWAASPLFAGRSNAAPAASSGETAAAAGDDGLPASATASPGPATLFPPLSGHPAR
jgi:hypothetical protein